AEGFKAVSAVGLQLRDPSLPFPKNPKPPSWGTVCCSLEPAPFGSVYPWEAEPRDKIGFVVDMAERALGEKADWRRAEMGRKRWTQGCGKQTAPPDGNKWVKSGSTAPSRPCRSQTSPENAARERSRVRNLRQAFLSLQAALPYVPPNTKLSKLDVLVLATSYIAHLTHTLEQGNALGEESLLQRAEYLHPVKKWPMRSLLYCGSIGERLTGAQVSQQMSSSARLKAD
ncbi:hypothetical protein DNTS_020847, partial [Danionella cerebrum]